MTRREFLAVAAAASCTAPACSFGDPSNERDDVTRYVKPFIGTGGHGHTYPGATVPFGMVQLSPDTGTSGWDHCSGYHYSDSSILGFSHTHLSGTGIGDMLDIILLPGDGRPLPFSHSDEMAEPGYYSVLFKGAGIRAELSATERAGIHQYTFAGPASSQFILDLDHGSGDHPKILSSQLDVIGSDTVAGGRQTAIWADGRRIFVVMQFSRPFKATKRLSDRKLLLQFDTGAGETIEVKTGLSGVSVDGARRT